MSEIVDLLLAFILLQSVCRRMLRRFGSDISQENKLLMDKKDRLSTNTGYPVSDNQDSLTAGQRGPTLLEDFHLLEKIAHFDREFPNVSSMRRARAHMAISKSLTMSAHTPAPISSIEWARKHRSSHASQLWAARRVQPMQSAIRAALL